MSAIGLVGGLGPGATIYYYEKLAKALAARADIASLVISHADLKFVLGRIEARALDELANYLAGHADRLKRAGATGIMW